MQENKTANEKKKSTYQNRPKTKKKLELTEGK